MELNKNKDKNILDKVTDKDISTDNNYTEATYSNILNYEKQIKEKDRLIVELQNMLENEKMKVQSYETKIQNVNKQYARFQEYKEILNKKINYLQENLIAKEEKINELEKKK